MTIPLDNRQITSLLSATLDAYRSEIIDNYFVSNALFVRLTSKNKVKFVGGDEIRSTFIYDELDGGSYGKGDTFSTDFKEVMTDLRLPWKRNYVQLSLDGLDEAVNRGAARIRNYAETMKDVAKMTLPNKVGYQLYGDGTGNAGKDIDGVQIAINNTGTYGGVTRAATGPGNAIKSVLNTTGGPYAHTMVQNAVGACTIGKMKPDLIITTQTIFNKIWAQSQTSERNTPSDLRKVGFDTVRFNNGIDVVVDNHCPAGQIHIFNTDYIEFHCLQGYELKMRGPFDLHLQDANTMQYIQYSNLVVKSPRLQNRIENVT